ncbi:hydrolase TatD [Oleiphilus sp. HI0125]|uniref:TatD family hydrolase n=1 Tax=Oleiphilus sp. HI0125 TaxID=1822266 RepID=UPI0007C3119A|nr:TatD family hydrolase [Oleiphilus sp. HI0125]KZZ58711.1 hydrolase TatD [Oleiphilus sp. HI0125]
MFIDSHCHLDRLKLEKYEGGLADAISAARDEGVSEMLCVAIDLEHIEDVLGAASSFDNIYASVGVHPTSYEGEEPSVERLLELSKREKVIAIGETGLDYYYSEDKKELQQERFIRHLEASAQCGKPVIVHTRDAKEDTLDIIAKHGDPSVAGVLHCFTEDLDMALRAIELGYYISFSGIVTFKNAVELQDVAKSIPLERMLIETDSPYLAPVPFRGKPNEPKYVPKVAEFIAELRGISVEEVAKKTAENFHALFTHARA